MPQAAAPETAAFTVSESTPHYLLPETAGLGTYRDFRESALAAMEKEYLQKLMHLAQGKVHEACRISGLSRSRLYGLMKKYQVSRLGWPSSS
jgi:transcriptional regulator of acetoin/glycerol metabolism